MQSMKVDTVEDDIQKLGKALLDILLIDRTTKKNILWATDDYKELGTAYGADKEILAELITAGRSMIIQPRTTKEAATQVLRTRNNAEVFTPSWICNIQNNLIDEVWFGRKDVFNIQKERTWETLSRNIAFPEVKKRRWQDYVDAKRLEITCGEAPYLVSRYDAASGKPISLRDRIGLYDRKLRVVHENASNDDEWLKWSKRATQSIYGYEFQLSLIHI